MSEMHPGVEASKAESSFADFAPLTTEPAPDEEAQARAREGLPRSYRMRADAHYVEQLDSTTAPLAVQLVATHAIEAAAEPALGSLVDSIKRHGVLEPILVQKHDRRYRVISGRKRLAAAKAVGLREVPCLVHRVDDDHARELAQATRSAVATGAARDSKASATLVSDQEVAHSLSSIRACAALLGDTSPRLTRMVATDLVRAEAWRASCLFHATRILRHGTPAGQQAVSIREVIASVRHAAQVEERLRRITLDVRYAGGETATVRGDEETLVFALSGLLLVLFSLLEQANAEVMLTALPEPAGRVTLAVSQEGISVPDSWPGLPMDAGETSRASSAQTLTAAARRVAESYGGSLAITRFANGSRILLELPTLHATGRS